MLSKKGTRPEIPGWFYKKAAGKAGKFREARRTWYTSQ
jgi:hypothetical protein